MAFIVVARALRLSADCSFPGFGFGFGFGLVRLVLLLGSAMDRLQFSTRFNYQLPRP